MTIEFNCPHCGALIAFDSKHAGRRAKCLSCSQKFLIPAESFQKARKVEAEPEPRRRPCPRLLSGGLSR
jgi:DNA-directed RNA polymerase subunit RPC12/RpoP